jgi:lambda family phage tail tape measure protein
MDALLRATLTVEDGGFNLTLKNAQQTLRSVAQSFDTTAKSVANIEDHLTSAATKFRNAVTMLGMIRFALMDLNDAFLTLPSSILKASGELERMSQVMRGLSDATTDIGKALDAQKGKDFLLDMAKNAPFSLKTLQDSFIKLKAGGLDPMAGSLNSLKDAVAKFGGNDQTMERASVALQQMAGKGVVSMEELRQQLGEAIPTAMKAMAEGAGVSLSAFTRHVSQGGVEATEAIQRMFFVLDFQSKGAAEQMMQTWTGMISRLKTTWLIMQDTIAQGGFMQEMKSVLTDLMAQLDRPETTQFLQNVGQNLQVAVMAITDFVKKLIEMGTFIKTVGESLLIYFIGSRVLSAWRSITATVTDWTARVNGAITMERDWMTARIENDARNAMIEGRRLQIAADTNAAELANRKAQLAAMLAEHQAYLQSLQVAEGLYRLNAAGRMVDESGKFVSSTVVASNNSNIAALERMEQAKRKLIDTERSAIQQLEAGIIVQRVSAQEHINLASSVEKGVVQVGALSKIAGFAGAALAAVGGPIGLIAAGLTIGIPLWLEYGNAAEKAMEKVQNAIRGGYATQADLDTINKALLNKQENLKFMQDQVNSINSRGGAATPEEQMLVDDYARRIASLTKEIDDLQKSRAEAGHQAFENEVNKAVQDVLKGAEKMQAARMSSVERQIAQDRADTEKKIQAMTDDNLRTQAYEQLAQRAANARAQFAKDELKRILDERKQIEDQIEGTDPDDTKQQAILAKQLSANDTALNQAKKFDEMATKFQSQMKFRDKEQKDPLTAAIESAQGNLESAKLRLNDLADGIISFETLREAAAARVMGQVKAGKFDKPDPSRPGHFNRVIDEATGDITPGREDQVKQLIDLEAQLDKVSAARTAATRITQLSAQANDDEAAALGRLDNQGEKAATGYERMLKTLDRLRVKLDDDTMRKFLGGQSFDEKKAQVLKSEAMADLANVVADFQAKDRTIASTMIVNQRDRLDAQYNQEIAHEQRMFDIRAENIRKTAGDDLQAQVELLKAYGVFNEHMELMAKQHAFQMRTPLEQLRDTWLDVAGQMEKATANWANGAIDQMMNFITTGKFEFKKFVESILTDMLRIKLQQTFANTLSELFGKIGDSVTGLFKSTGPDGGKLAEQNARQQNTMAVNMGTPALEAFTMRGEQGLCEHGRQPRRRHWPLGRHADGRGRRRQQLRLRQHDLRGGALRRHDRDGKRRHREQVRLDGAQAIRRRWHRQQPAARDVRRGQHAGSLRAAARRPAHPGEHGRRRPQHPDQRHQPIRHACRRQARACAVRRSEDGPGRGSAGRVASWAFP